MPNRAPTTERPELHVVFRDRLYPVLPAALTSTGTQMEVWCKYCDKLHSHSPSGGHRAAHCFVKDSPYSETGYWLLPVGTMTPEDLVPSRSQRRRPRSPTARDPEYRHRWRP